MHRAGGGLERAAHELRVLLCVGLRSLQRACALTHSEDVVCAPGRDDVECVGEAIECVDHVRVLARRIGGDELVVGCEKALGLRGHPRDRAVTLDRADGLRHG